MADIPDVVAASSDPRGPVDRIPVLGWLLGRPARRSGLRWWRWVRRLAVAGALGYLVLYGPAARLLPAVPGFRQAAEGRITIHYQPGLEHEIPRVRSALREAERAVLEFWGRPGDGRFPRAVDLYLCESRRRYWHLIMNHAPASASGGDIFLVAGYPEEELVPFLRHELTHTFITHQFGWLGNLLRVPAWLNEGIATTLQASDWSDEAGLARFLARSPELASLRSTPNVLRWRGAVDGGGNAAGAQYAYVRAFTEDLLERYGRDAILDYLREATLSGDQERAFARFFGSSLAVAEPEWIAARIGRGELPAELALVDRGLSTSLTVKLAVAVALVALLMLWSFRQACRALRWAARRP